MELPDEKVLDILAEFEATLAMPPRRPGKQLLVCPVGLIGSGKTTVMKPLARRLELLRISGDELRSILQRHGYDFERNSELMTQIVHKYLDLGYSIGIDSDAVNKLEMTTDMASRYGAVAIWIQITAPEALILERIRNRPSLLASPESFIENYHSRKKDHEGKQFPFLYTFDTSKENLEAQLDEAVRLIQHQATVS